MVFIIKFFSSEYCLTLNTNIKVFIIYQVTAQNNEEDLLGPRVWLSAFTGRYII